MKKILFLTALLISAFNLFAQPPGGKPGGMGAGRPGMAAPSIGHIFGKLVDSTGKAIGDASVMILHSKFDNKTKKTKEVLLKGKATESNGEFSFEELPVSGPLKIKISATGYKSVEQTVSFQRKPGGTNDQSGFAGGQMPGAMGGAFDKDLGKITLRADIRQLQDVIVTATSSGRLKMDIDKKVFSVDKNIVTAGGSALDVMKNVPSVNVDIDGNVALRNAPPQLFVDGRPTTLTLEQIPADAIESVEVITNPSAKYDASGGGAGILNIVLKKNKRTGYNGNLRAGIDRLGAKNGGVDFNVRQGKVNFFGSLNVNQRKSNTVGSVNRNNLTDTPRTIVNQNNTDKSTGRFIFGRAGLDYFVTNRTTLSLAGFRVNGQFRPGELIDITTDSLFNNGIKSSFSDRISSGKRSFNGKGLAFGLKQLFAKEGEELTADVNYFSGKSEMASFYTTNRYTGGAGSSIQSKALQQLLGGGTDYNVILQTDYVKPISSKTKLETGLRAAMRGRENNNSNYFFDYGINDYKLIPSTSNNYKNNDNVYAAYASITSSIKNFGYKLGLRAESSNYNGELTNTSEKFGNSYPISLFPSIFLSQKLKGNQELQFSVTRRINRPNFFQLIPFADYTDELNITQGNPNLVPEFTSSFEMSYSKTFNKNHNFLASAYYKKTTNLITRFLDKGVNPFTGREAFINTYINANSSESYGTEFTSQNFFTKWWDVTTNVNVYNSTINAANVKDAQTNSMWSVLGKLNSNFKLPADLTAQLSATYQSKTNLPPGGEGGFGGPPGARGGGGGGGPRGGGFGQAQSAAQGYIQPFYGIDIAIRKNFLKNKAASATLSFSDIFRTRSFNQYSESEYFTQYYNRLRDPQMIRLTLAYRFGKVDALLFKRKNNQTGQGAADSMQQ